MNRHLEVVRRRRSLILFAAFVTLVTVAPAAQLGQYPIGSQPNDPRSAATSAIAADKSAYVAKIVSTWEGYASEWGFSTDTWRTELTAVLNALTPETLYDAGLVTTYADLVAVISGRQVTNQAAVASLSQKSLSPTSGPLVLGSDSSDLVYFPVTPCRVIDTRLATAGIVAANETRAFVVNGSLTAQGGNPSGCGLPSDPAAVALTLTVTGSTGGGWLTVWPYLGAMPNASVLNWNAADTHANTTIVPQCQICGSDINIKASSAAVHVIADVVGYFWSPTATAVSSTTLSTQYSLGGLANSNVYSPNCPAGTTPTGGGFASSSWTNVALVSSVQSGSGWACAFHNTTNIATEVYCYVYCTKVPGR